jgi:hypothetical protein
MMRDVRRLLVIGFAAGLLGCTEDATAPGRCPQFCPPGQIKTVDTVLNIISRDSTYRGYVRADSAVAMLAADLPGVVDSRAVFRLGPINTRVVLLGTDTTTSAALHLDSARLTLTVLRWDTAATHLRVSLYRLPLTVDETTAFGDLAGPFTDSLIRSVNVDSLLALATHRDSITGDSVFVVDTATRQFQLLMKLDTAAARYVASDSGKVAYGIRVSADSLASVAFGSVNGGAGPTLAWWGSFDSAGTTVTRALVPGANAFNTFLFTPPPAPLDSNLLVGGVPAARSLLRITLPRGIRDSSQIVRATLVLVPISAPLGAPSDSVVLNLYRLDTDVGGKSPLAQTANVDSSLFVPHTVLVGQADSIQIEVTQILRFWQSDTIAPQALMIRQAPEGANLTSLRLYSSRTAAFRPTLHITYIPRFSFGSP